MTDGHFTGLIQRVRQLIRAHGRGEDLGASGSPEAFESLARELFAAQFQAVPPYQALCRARGVTPEALEDWRDIPAVPTSAFKAFDFTSLPSSERVRMFQSSGTTGAVPSRHHHSPESLALYADSLHGWFRPHLLPDADPARDPASGPPRWRFLVLAPPTEIALHSSLAFMFTEVAARWSCPGPEFLAAMDAEGQWHLQWPRAQELLAHAAGSNTPVVLLGTAFMFVHLLDGLTARFALPPGSRVLETGGYKGRSREVSRNDLYAGITHTLGIPESGIVSEYGMSELSSQAYDHVAAVGGEVGAADVAVRAPEAPAHNASRSLVRHPLRQFRFPPWARAWVLSPEDGHEVAAGGTGILRVLDLANVRSVMAVQTEDLVVRRGEGFELLGRLPRAEAKGCSLLAR